MKKIRMDDGIQEVSPKNLGTEALIPWNLFFFPNFAIQFWNLSMAIMPWTHLCFKVLWDGHALEPWQAKNYTVSCQNLGIESLIPAAFSPLLGNPVL